MVFAVTTKLLRVVVLVGFIELGYSLNVNDTCSNPEGKPGRCILLRECQPLLSIYRKSHINLEESNFITKSQCGKFLGRALVCCPTPTPGHKLPGSNECGIDMQDRILNGTATNKDEFPWTALILHRSNNITKHHCGGSLINNRYVVTAAHCILKISKNWEIVGVRLGEYNTSNDGQDCIRNDCADLPVDVGIEETIVHEGYNVSETAQWNDIALLRLDREVSLTDFIQPICLPIADNVRNRNLGGQKAIAAGWGKTESRFSSPIKLKVALDIISFHNCSSKYKLFGANLRGTQFCAGGKDKKDTCQGDSGGPLMQRVSSNYYLYGIVSFGPIECGTKNFPGVYTNVPMFIEWIESHMK